MIRFNAHGDIRIFQHYIKFMFIVRVQRRVLRRKTFHMQHVFGPVGPNAFQFIKQSFRPTGIDLLSFTNIASGGMKT